VKRLNDPYWHKLAVQESAFSASEMSALEIFYQATINP